MKYNLNWTPHYNDKLIANFKFLTNFEIQSQFYTTNEINYIEGHSLEIY